MIRTIATTVEAASLSDLSAEWKIVARQCPDGWEWFGDISHRALNELPGAQPLYSTVSGREPSGRLVIYARIYPVMRKRSRYA